MPSAWTSPATAATRSYRSKNSVQVWANTRHPSTLIQASPYSVGGKGGEPVRQVRDRGGSSAMVVAGVHGRGLIPCIPCSAMIG